MTFFFIGIRNCASIVVEIKEIAKQFSQADTPVSAFCIERNTDEE